MPVSYYVLTWQANNWQIVCYSDHRSNNRPFGDQTTLILKTYLYLPTYLTLDSPLPQITNIQIAEQFLLAFPSHDWNNTPFDDWPVFNHSNTKLISYSDPTIHGVLVGRHQVSLIFFRFSKVDEELLKDIFKRIGQKEATRQGLLDLYNFKQRNPHADRQLEPFLVRHK